MTADDVRARFEAWVQKTRGWAACKARNKPMYLRQTADGNYCDYRVNDRWMAYRAAHADLSGEVRELAEALKAAQWDCHGKCPVCAGFMVGPNGETRHAHTASCPVGSALAKHQEKP